MDLIQFKSDFLLTIVGSAIVVHSIFKKTETFKPRNALTLIFGVPAALSYFYRRHAEDILPTAITVFAVFWISLLGSISLYRISPWHPLARYPGPFLGRLSKFHVAFQTTKGKQYLYYYEMFEKYGDVVRIGPNEIIIRDVNAVEPLYGSAGLPKGPFWEGSIPESGEAQPLIALRDKSEHTRRRRSWTRAFTTLALKGYEEQVTKRATQLVESLASQQGTVDLTKWISFFSYDIMSDLAFGGGSEMLAEGDASGRWNHLEVAMEEAAFLSQVPWLGFLVLRFPFVAADLKAFHNHARSRAALRKEEGSQFKDIYHHLLDVDGVAVKPPTIFEVLTDGVLAIVAGADTTATALTHICYFLMSHPKAYKRLQEEIDKLGDDYHDCTKQAHMPYLNAVINEGLRLLPPILGGSQRQPDKGSGGKMIGPYFLPEGNNALIPTYSLHRDPRCFSPFPHSFIPERWLSEEKRMAMESDIFGKTDEYIHNNLAFIPFSFGPKNCVGKNLAYLELRMVLCLLIRRLDMKLEPSYNSEQWYVDLMDYFVSMKGVLPVVFTPTT